MVKPARQFSFMVSMARMKTAVPAAAATSPASLTASGGVKDQIHPGMTALRNWIRVPR